MQKLSFIVNAFLVLLIAELILSDPISKVLIVKDDYTHPKHLNPIIWYANGCSGSTITYSILRNLLSSLHGISTSTGGSNGFEALKVHKNSVYEKALARNPVTAHYDVIFEMFNIARKRNATLMINPPPLNAENTRALLELNATIISMTRANSLDRLICTVRDCFGSHGNSYPVDSSTGKKSDLCFARRSTPEAQITAHLDPVLSLVEKEMKSVKNQTSLLRSLGWVQKKIPSVHYEDLTAFESGEQFLQRSSEAWMKVMAAVGLPFKSLDQAKQTLKKLERKSEIFYNSRPVPGSQEKSVHNWDQVKKALLKSGNPDIAAMIRTSDT